MTKTAVILFNLGGPDSLDAVEPFLFNLFNDRDIISLPNPFRWVLARLISTRRKSTACEIYKHLGGRSPLLELTREQGKALTKELTRRDPAQEFKTFIAMRYWHPMSLETAEKVRDFAPDRVVLLPLYPQYSMTTTGSSMKEWKRASTAVGLDVQTSAVCCYPVQPGWIEAQCELISEAMESRLNLPEMPRILFSAHGLPKKIIAKGDPYQAHVELTCNALVARLQDRGLTGFDWSICYQSRVGRLEWIGPSTEDELSRAAKDNVAVMVVPVAFVSEHSETLVELDIEYRELALGLGVVGYQRVPAVGVNTHFIAGLSDMVMQMLRNGETGGTMCIEQGERVCSTRLTQCPLKAAN